MTITDYVELIEDFASVFIGLSSNPCVRTSPRAKIFFLVMSMHWWTTVYSKNNLFFLPRVEDCKKWVWVKPIASYWNIILIRIFVFLFKLPAPEKQSFRVKTQLVHRQ